MSRGLNGKFNKLVFLFVALLPFQNCGPGFSVMKVSRLNSQNFSSVEALQTKALAILTTNCKSCHGDQPLGNIPDIRNVDFLLSSGLIVPGDPVASKLIKRVEDGSMPPSGPLSQTDKQSLRNWVLALGGLGTDGAPLDLSFSITLSTDLLPFPTRLAKVSRLTSSTGSETLSKLKADHFVLGDYDYAKTIVPKISWEATDMKNWLESINPVCASSEVRDRYPFPSGAQAFLAASLGRASNAIDDSVIQEISALGVSNEEKFEVFCLTVLSSLEFVAK